MRITYNICLYVQLFVFEILLFVFVIIFDNLKVFVFQIHSNVFDPMSDKNTHVLYEENKNLQRRNHQKYFYFTKFFSNIPFSGVSYF